MVPGGKGKGEQVEIRDANGNVQRTLTGRTEFSELFDAFQLDESRMAVLVESAQVRYVCVLFQQRTRRAGEPSAAPDQLERTAVFKLYDQPYLSMEIDGLRFTFQIQADAVDRVEALVE